ncbi:hypothetical protein QAD02_005048 [Eretmocerus hayati]|uniref:Uncharacterized protein n=1 Tax=Eretmocerus hayati TaxID=131215 RepID=A0ACC2NSD6_9HYME|nr:hypothetical protein QAD02_005048 [Eretmocerus hayati]
MGANLYDEVSGEKPDPKRIYASRKIKKRKVGVKRKSDGQPAAPEVVPPSVQDGPIGSLNANNDPAPNVDGGAVTSLPSVEPKATPDQSNGQISAATSVAGVDSGYEENTFVEKYDDDEHSANHANKIDHEHDDNIIGGDEENKIDDSSAACSVSLNHESSEYQVRNEPLEAQSDNVPQWMESSNRLCEPTLVHGGETANHGIAVVEGLREGEIGMIDENESTIAQYNATMERTASVRESVAEDDVTESVIGEHNYADTSHLRESEGCRQIVRMKYVFQCMKRAYLGHLSKSEPCAYENWDYLNERTIFRGLLARFQFRCSKCEYSTFVWSDAMDDTEVMNVNEGAILAVLSAGFGHYQAEKFLGGIDVHFMCDRTFTKTLKKVQNDIQRTFNESCKTAARKEWEIANAKGNVTQNGKAIIQVTADESWLTRSYGLNFKSLCGMAVIVGVATGEVLAIGTKNKYCAVCLRAERDKVDKKPHECTRTWGTYESSSAMEACIVIECCDRSADNLNLIFGEFVIDGDGELQKLLKEYRGYTDNGIKEIKFVICINHILRNFCKRLQRISITTQKRNEEKVDGYYTVRNKIEASSRGMRKAVEAAIELRRAEPVSDDVKEELLAGDLRNIPNHIFGDHSKCREHKLTCVTDVEDEKNQSLMNVLRKTKLHDPLVNSFEILVSHTRSLLVKQTTNSSEDFHSVIAALENSKRVLHPGIQYPLRCELSAVQYNSKAVLTRIHRNKNKIIPAVMSRLERRRKMKCQYNKQARREKRWRPLVKKYKSSKKHYGVNCQKADMTNLEFEKAKAELIAKLKENQANRFQFERDTVLQRESDKWRDIHKKTLSASHFETAAKWDPVTRCANRVKLILFPDQDTIERDAAVKYGRDQEQLAKAKLKEEYGESMQECGAFVHEKHEFLICSPDATINDDGIMEIKCPYSAANMKAEDAIIQDNNVRKWFINGDTTKMNKDHRVYHQIIGQIEVANKSYYRGEADKILE